MSTTLGTAAMLDSIGRFVANVGVPAAIAFLVLWQLTPKLDQMVVLQTQTNTQLAILGTSCAPRSYTVQP